MIAPVPTDVDAALTRLFALLGVAPPRQGSVTLDFHEGRLQVVRPTSVIRVRREKPIEGVAQRAHTRSQT